MTFNAVATLLSTAKRPEDVFGILDKQMTSLDEMYKSLAKIVHPDIVKPKNRSKAEEAFKELSEFLTKAKVKVLAGTYGIADEIVLSTKTQTYTLGAKLAAGDFTDIYHATNNGGIAVLVKVPRNADNNDLMANEAITLTALWSNKDFQDSILKVHFPTLLDSFEAQQPGDKRKFRINVLKPVDECFTLAQVLEAYPKGLDIRDAAWMWNRLLETLTVAHNAGFVHGAILPEHFLICPENHNGVLIDWSYAVKPKGKIKAISPAYKSWYPHEVLEQEPATFGTDIFMAARLMEYLLGTDGREQVREQRQFNGLLRSCWLHNSKRPQNAHTLFKEFNTVLTAMVGPKKFRPFKLPIAVAA